MDDLTDQYNTPLTPNEQMAYEVWAKTGGRDPIKERADYDLQGYYKNTNGAPLTEGHLTDQFKKPNHPTFSSESQYSDGKNFIGGQWQKLPNGKFNFVPGRTNLQYWGPQGLQQYFDKYEPDTQLVFPTEGQ